MTIWQELLAGFTAFFGGGRTRRVARPVAFTVAVVALAAKMAKADGRVTADEIQVFRRSFHTPAGEMENVARVFDLARRSIHGFESYARQLRRLFAGQHAVLEEVLDVLFLIAEQDGGLKPDELAFLAAVASEMGLTPGTFDRVRAGRGGDADDTPHMVLGVPLDADRQTIQSAWRTLVRELHPDRLIANGMPEAFVAVAQARLVAVNHAYAALMRRQSSPTADGS